MTLKSFFLTAAAAAAISAGAAVTPVYLDENAPIEERVEDALSRMTTREKNQHHPRPV